MRRHRGDEEDYVQIEKLMRESLSGVLVNEMRGEKSNDMFRFRGLKVFFWKQQGRDLSK